VHQRDFTEVIRLIPNIAYVFNNRADAYKAKGELDRAIADYSEAIRLDPTNELTYMNRGNAWHRKGDIDRAIADFTEAIRLHPIARAYYGRGIAWHDKGDFNRAIADYDQAIRLDPSDALGLGTQSAKGYAEKRSAAPPPGARTAQRDLGADQAALVNKAMAAFEAKNWNEAEAAWKELVRLDPSRWDYQQALGATQLNLGHYDDAIASFGAGIRLVEKSATGSSPEAAKAKSALGMMLTNQGNALLRQKKNDNAIAAFEKATAIDPNPAIAYFNLCATQYNTGKVEHAVSACDKAIAADPNKADAYFIKGSVLYAEATTNSAGKLVVPAGAIKALRKYLTLAPNGPHATDVRQMLDFAAK
jgi:tetratricopeptide (TPR) repeat protein